ncbi:ATP-dependent DNA ligase [Kaistia algarum]|uniref:cisplatin damage response ATP-dependent DNA ligase n=1 Tax=Kaistia algarum TaxID=2083279 RepID=UPI000CE8F37B|nr:cisplatin damage response ATP-dependent DNA ligase [Kaistia algarum]MCX5513348.1 cisplatin damage response ATP-dependent DNA ligase [Kaistia algarum]PPE81202.1 ATP-dependent DNA ligase [Kaistia algarum]
MQAFAALLDRLILTPSRNAKLRLLADYFRATPDPDRGWALAALTGELDVPSVKPAMLRAMASDRMDAVLFAYSYDYVGDLAETIALVWEPSAEAAAAAADRQGKPSLAAIVESLLASSRSEGPKRLAAFLDDLDPSGRWALLKLVTGGLRIGISARLAKQALADIGAREVNELEELWHGLKPPYAELFAWLEGRAEKPVSSARAPFRPVMLSQPLEEADRPRIVPEAYAAEWKWDGIRVQAVSDHGVRRLYTRTGDDIGDAFPDVLEGLDIEGTIDGELLVGRAKDNQIEAGTFSELQQRLNRKSVSGKLIISHPAFIRAYDCLVDGEQDVRALSFRERRQRLETIVAGSLAKRIDLSPILPFADFDDLLAKRVAPPAPIIEGVMLKRWDSVYEPGRPKGPWFKWKRDPYVIDAVLMYAQRGHGKRSSFYSDYTFGVWRAGEAGDELVPVGKAYFGFTDDELAEIDRFVRRHTINRFGPVREVEHRADLGLVFEVAFEGLNRSARHRSGVAMRFPRISRLRWDKPPAEADRIETLEAMIADEGP